MLYAFALTTSLGKLLYKLKSPDHCYIVYSNNIDHYLDLLIHDQPSHILGLGSYSGIDQDKIRIERITTNQSRNGKVEENAPNKLKINSFLPLSIPSENFKYAEAIGNSWCNLISWKIMRLIEKGVLHSQYTFLHVPKNFDQGLATLRIENVLNL